MSPEIYSVPAANCQLLPNCTLESSFLPSFIICFQFIIIPLPFTPSTINHIDTIPLSLLPVCSKLPLPPAALSASSHSRHHFTNSYTRRGCNVRFLTCWVFASRALQSPRRRISSSLSFHLRFAATSVQKNSIHLHYKTKLCLESTSDPALNHTFSL